ncbi:MAG: Fe-S cluster assembly protein SufD [Bacteroidetes bacterium]|nr:Fe-S cluster assembly protein SufD [Bacteroidota bacterium]
MVALETITDLQEKLVTEFHVDKNARANFSSLREKAIKSFSSLGFPTLRNEDWKYTSLSSIINLPYEIAGVEQIEKFDSSSSILKERSIELVFINGHFASKLSDTGLKPDGIVLDTFSRINDEVFSLIKSKYGALTNIDDNAMVALNTAHASDPFLVYIPDNTMVEPIIHFKFISQNKDSNVISFPRILIITGKNTEVKLLESFGSEGSGMNFSNLVSEIFVGENSRVEHFKFQSDPNESVLFNETNVVQSASCKYSNNTISMQGKLIRNNLNIVLQEEGSETELFGLFMTKDRNHIDNHTLVDHVKPNCVSNELYKGIINDRSTGVFNGKIMVRQDAQKTNAFQSNKNMLLTDTATINTKPQLEIFADDVKCSHGATTGQLDMEAMFYLQSRGISPGNAKAMLLEAFANEIVDKIKIDSLRDSIKVMLGDYLKV